MSTSGLARRALRRGGRLVASMAVVAFSAACAIDVTDYTPFGRDAAATRVARATKSDPVVTASVPKSEPARSESVTRSPTAATTVVVAPGETLSHIARRHRVSVERIARVNGISRPDRIRIGQRLVLPDSASAAVAPASAPARSGTIRQPAPLSGQAGVKVARGDTLYSIARRHGVGVDDLMLANAIRDPSRIRPGQELILPYQRVASSAPPAAASPEITGSVATPAKPAKPARKQRPWTQSEAEVELSKVMSEFRMVPGQSALAPF